MKIVEHKEVNSKDWLLTVALSENEHYQQLLDDKNNHNIGSCKGLTFIEIIDEDNSPMGRCIYYYDYAFKASVCCAVFVYPQDRNKGVATKLIEYCQDKAQEDKTDLVLYTRVLAIKKICKKLNLKFTHKELNDYSNLEDSYFRYTV